MCAVAADAGTLWRGPRSAEARISGGIRVLSSGAALEKTVMKLPLLFLLLVCRQGRWPHDHARHGASERRLLAARFF